MRARRRRRISVQPRFFVILALIAVLILTPVFFFVLRDRDYAIATSTVTESIQAEAVVIRRETVVAARQTGSMQMLVSEGDLVEDDQDVAQVYSVQYDEGALEELSHLRDDIVTYQKNDILGDIFDADLAAMDAQIDEVTQQICDAVAQGDAAAAKTLSNQLSALISQREAYLRRNYRIDETLSSMLEKEADLSDRIDSWTTNAKAPHAGYVSFYMDGCEHILNADMLDQLDVRTMQSTVQQASQHRVTQATEYTSLFRVVDESGFYLAVPMDEQMELVQGKGYTVTVKEAGQSFHATLLLGDAYAANGLHVFYIEDDPAQLLRLRDVHIQIEKEFDGLSIPRRALYRNQGVYGVYLMQGDEKVFVPVTVLAREGNMVSIESDALAISSIVRLK